MSNRPSTRLAVILSVIALILFCTSASGDMYRWVDENGVTVYSQTPPASGNAVRIAPQPGGPRASDQDVAQESSEALTGESSAAEDEQTPSAEDKKKIAEEKKKKAEEDARRTKNCNAARQNLETLRNLGNRMVRTPDGRYLRLSEDQVERKIDEAQRQIDTYCKQ